MQNNTITFQTMPTSPHNLGNTFIKRVTKGNMCDNPALEVGPWAHTLGTVNDLIWDNKIAGLDLFLQTPDGRESNDTADTDRAKSSYIGTSGDLMGRNLVMQTVTAQEGNGNNLVIMLAVVVKNRDWRGGLAPRSSN